MHQTVFLTPTINYGVGAQHKLPLHPVIDGTPNFFKGNTGSGNFYENSVVSKPQQLIRLSAELPKEAGLPCNDPSVSIGFDRIT
jgi:hypothetical protein